LITYKTLFIPHIKKVVTSEDRRYYYKVGKSFHYSIHLLSTFIKRCQQLGIYKDDINVIYDNICTPGVIKADIQDTYTDRKHQPVYITKALETKPMVLIDLNTGKGKTYISMRVVTELKRPTGVIVLSRYIDKWIGDVKELTTVEDEDIYVVKGKDSLAKLLKQDHQYDFIIFSLSTLRNYIKNYDNDPNSVEVSPERLFDVLGLGIMINDEVHQSFHAVYMTTIRLNPQRTIAMSATLDNLDHKISHMYDTLYPSDHRCGNLVTFDAHPVVIAVNYYIDNPKYIRCIGPRGYSHIVFEQHMMRHSIFRNMYMDMLLQYIKKGYISRREPGDKLLILVQTVKFATLMTNYLSREYPKLDINRYVEEDPYENIIESDISVSTNLSSATAIDIPNLITVLQTVSIRSLQANVQALGRLREIPGKEVRYYYTYSSNLDSQYKLHLARKSVISHLAKEYLFEEYSKRLKSR